MVGPHYKMQTDYIMPRPKGTPRRLLHFPRNRHQADISTRSLAANPNLTPGLEATTPSPGGHTFFHTGPGGRGATHLH